MDKKKPKFYCDFCGNEVKQNDISCKKCGKFFSAVRCPSCGKTGTADVFTNGCPKCGYAFDKGINQKTTTTKPYLVKPNTVGNDPLPVWIYIVTIAAVLLIVGFGSILYF